METLTPKPKKLPWWQVLFMVLPSITALIASLVVQAPSPPEHTLEVDRSLGGTQDESNQGKHCRYCVCPDRRW